MGLYKNIGMVCLAVLLSVCFVSGLPAEDCSKAENTLAIIECYQQRYEKADKEMNEVYRDAMKSLPPAARQKLKIAQRAWLKYRDAGLAFAMEINKDLRSYGEVVVANYKATVVEKRVLELKYLMAGPAGPPVQW